jgi:hypothetical protein
VKLHEPWLPALPYRACDLCTRGVTVAGERRYTCKQLLASDFPEPVPVRFMRSLQGGCGPDARFLDFPGLH